MSHPSTDEPSRGDEPPADVLPGTRRWLLIAVIAVAIAAVAFALGRFTAFGASAAPVHPSTVSAEAGFARDMQVHHAQAVEMSMEIFGKTEDAEVRTLAHDIATAQSGQRGEMYGWLVQWGLPQAGEPLMTWMQDSGHGTHSGSVATEEELRADMGMATSEQLSQLATATGVEADCLYLQLMIDHHRGAIPMAEAVLELGEEPRVLAVAEGMIGSQGSEIAAMQSMRARLGCTD